MSINLYVHTMYNSAHVLTLYFFFHKSVIAASCASSSRVYLRKKNYASSDTIKVTAAMLLRW